MNNYEQQAFNFLDKTKTDFFVSLANPQKSPIWAKDGKHGLHYWVVLKNDRYQYGFDFWGSIADKEKIEIAKEIDKTRSADLLKEKLASFLKDKGLDANRQRYILNCESFERKIKELITPSAYDVLACLDPFFDYANVDVFAEDFGYNKPSLAIATFNACQEQAKELKKLFSSVELEELAEIN